MCIEMKNIVDFYVKDNSDWVNHYDSRNELRKIRALVETIGIDIGPQTCLADIGCGSGRSSVVLSRVVNGKGTIIGVDKRDESIKYAKSSISLSNVEFIKEDAFSFLSLTENKKRFDAVFFVWSFFDMPSDASPVKKKLQLARIINSSSSCLKDNGYIVVLQPTKGGSFEKLLSLFIPTSIDSYQETHDTLIAAGFSGARRAIPSRRSKWAIWSCFRYSSMDELYRGVASIIFLEERRILNRVEFDEVMLRFREQHRSRKNVLTDCVNIYYLKKEFDQ